jgi:hypothetical protein
MEESRRDHRMPVAAIRESRLKFGEELIAGRKLR